MTRVGVDNCCLDIFEAKRECLAIKLDGLSVATANVLKQTALAAGGDCAVHRRVVSGKVSRSDAILFVSRRQFGNLVPRLLSQPDCVAGLVPELTRLAGYCHNPDLAVRFGRRRVDFGARTYVMGILNITPDSFYDGGRYVRSEAAVERAIEMEEQGADFIDIGAESTRPGSDSVPARVQLSRLLPVLKGIRRKVKARVSVDTTSARVAEAALGEGADVVNDISGFSFDRRMAGVVARAGVPCVVMHLPGRPKTMQRKTVYKDLMAEIVEWLDAALARGERAGVRRTQMIVDPGIGFGKKLEQNIEILRRLRELRSLGRPVLVGPSRKSFVGMVTRTEPEDRLAGTIAACVIAAGNGANVLRVHDVRQVKRALGMAEAIRGRS